MKLIDQIKAIMREQGVTQAELARRLGVTSARVSQVMSGGVSPGTEALEQWAEALGCEWRLVLRKSRRRDTID